jgi:hypothetical protein
MSETAPVRVPARADRAFLLVEHGLMVVIGAILSITAAVALGGTAVFLFEGLRMGGTEEALLIVIDRLLFVLMLAEILHTVRVSLSSGTLDGEPFLIVGLIASIRRVLVITLESSQTAPGSVSGNAPTAFVSSMIELGLLAVVILVMVTSIYLLRRAKRA